MDFKNLCLDQLAMETIRLSEQLSGLDPFENSFTDSTLNSETYPTCPGLIYKIEKNLNTFCIKAIPVESISSGMKSAMRRDNFSVNRLKITDESDLENILFFETKSFENAELLMDLVANKRFPYYDDGFYNIGDPNQFWWFEDRGNSFAVYFTSQRRELDPGTKLMKLGPIGDGDLAQLRWNKSLSFFKSLFPVSEFSCDDRSLIVGSTNNSINFDGLKKIFSCGDNFLDKISLEGVSITRTLYYYLQEISYARKFWIQIEGNLLEKNNHCYH